MKLYWTISEGTSRSVAVLEKFVFVYNKKYQHRSVKILIQKALLGILPSIFSPKVQQLQYHYLQSVGKSVSLVFH